MRRRKNPTVHRVFPPPPATHLRLACKLQHYDISVLPSNCFFRRERKFFRSWTTRCCKRVLRSREAGLTLRSEVEISMTCLVSSYFLLPPTAIILKCSWLQRRWQAQPFHGLEQFFLIWTAFWIARFNFGAFDKDASSNKLFSVFIGNKYNLTFSNSSDAPTWLLLCFTQATAALKTGNSECACSSGLDKILATFWKLSL